MKSKGKNLTTAHDGRSYRRRLPNIKICRGLGVKGYLSPLPLRRIFSSLCSTAAIGLLSVTFANAQPSADEDLTQFSLEQLINIEVYSASKFLQKASDAPAAVTVITAADIKTYGYRKLADILKSIRGIYGRYDRNYDFIGLRGFGRPGDYQSRFLLLLDGYRLNDAVFDAATVSTDFILDVDLIDRVEFVPGPGSSIYGSNAFFGVVNVITRTAKDVKGLEVSMENASYDTNKARLTYGGSLDNGLRIVVSGSFYDSKGRDLYFSEFDTPATDHGIAHHLDYDRYDSFFTKISYSAFTLTAACSDRKKGVPTAAFDTPFNNPASATRDRQTFIDLQYDKSYSEKLNVLARIYYGEYPYDGDYPLYDNTHHAFFNYDDSRPKWAGGEIKLVNTQFDKHKLVYGAEYRDNIHQDLFNHNGDPSAGYSGHNRSRRHALYLQDEYEIGKNWLINAGARYDSYSDSGEIVNPRLGLIYKPDPSSAIKLLYGTAFRAPNVYELYYQSEDQKANPNLKPEKIKTYDLIFEKYYDNRLRFTAGAFYYQTRDLLDSHVDPTDNLSVYDNIEAVDTRGVEFEAEHHWKNGAKIRSSLTLQKTRDAATGDALPNSPKVLAKFNGTAPLFNTKMQSGLELQYTGRRTTSSQGTVGGYTIANLTLLGTQWVKNLDVSMSIYNLLGKKYSDPSGLDVSNTTPGVPPGLDTVSQDAQTYRLKLTYRF
ncbi:MAG: TonB-dependent receptor [Pseudomonadota bacterium]